MTIRFSSNEGLTKTYNEGWNVAKLTFVLIMSFNRNPDQLQFNEYFDEFSLWKNVLVHLLCFYKYKILKSSTPSKIYLVTLPDKLLLLWINHWSV